MNYLFSKMWTCSASFITLCVELFINQQVILEAKAAKTLPFEVGKYFFG